MYLTENDINVNISEVQEESACRADIVYDLEGYSKESCKDILFIEIETDRSQLKILLYCSCISDYEHCSILHNNYLTIAKFNTVYRIDVYTGKIEYTHFFGMGGAFQLYLLEDGYLIHGEMEVVKLDFSLNKLWDFWGEDIFVSLKDEEWCKVYSDRVELIDFLGNHYTVSLETGREI